MIVIGSTKYSWRPVSAGVSQRLIVGPVLVNICINNVSDERVQLQQIAGGAKPGGVVDTPEGCGGSGEWWHIPKDLKGRWEDWASMSLKKFLTWGAKPQLQDGLRADQDGLRGISVCYGHQVEQKAVRCGQWGQQPPELHQERCQQLERWFFLSAQHWQGHISGFSSTREVRMC